MSDKAAIAGTYSDFKIIRSRKVAQLIIEVPIEQAQALISALGLPNPAEETWVAVARLKPQTPAKEETPPTASPVDLKAHRRFEDLPYSWQAALRCQDMSFREWLREFYEPDIHDAEDAARFVRGHCGVTSRSDIRPGTKAEKIWERLNLRYTLWESARAA
jgi:hypothetical protein